ncbi:MAG TPA: glycosyltransferase [Candidatus Saccharimonadales bacterium]|nr:glycosyltransferase [Candidatus Saccharimonadales bacterium]
MLLSILFYIFIVVGTIHLVHFALFLIGGNLYDIKYFNRTRRKSRRKNNGQTRVTVLVPAYNEELVIERCIQSIWDNTHKNTDIVVISDGSTDGTAAAVQRFMDNRTRIYRHTKTRAVRTKYSLRRVWQRGGVSVKRRIKLVQQTNHGKGSALNRGLRYHTRGELVMSVDADSILHPKAIANVIKYFDDPNVAGVAANVRIVEKNRVLAILQRFEHMVGYRSKKFFTLTNSELIIGGVASTYRRSVLQQVGNYDTDTVTEDIGLSMKVVALGNKKNRLVYAYDVAAMTEGVGDFRTLLKQRYRWKLGNLQNLVKYRQIMFSRDSKYSFGLRWYRMPMAYIGELLLLLEPVALGYVIYLSVRFFTPVLILTAYTAITAYLLLVIWPDEHMNIKGKLKASLYVPFLYFIFYIMNAVQFISVIRCLKNHKTVVGLSSGHTNWVSPKRAGGTVSFS